MHTQSKKTIAAPGLAEMLSALSYEPSGHPGEGWFTAEDLAEASSIHVTTARRRANELVEQGIYEACHRKIKRWVTAFYRIAPSRCSTKATMNENPVRSSPTTPIPLSKGKRSK